MIVQIGRVGMTKTLTRMLWGLEYRQGVVVLKRNKGIIAMGIVWSAKRDIRRALDQTGADDFYFLPDKTPIWKLERMQEAWPGVKVWTGAKPLGRVRGEQALAKLLKASGL